jgi:hypothetical protein
MRLKLTASKGMSDQMRFVSESDSGLTESLPLSIARPFDYVALLKPRVMSLVIFTAFTGVLVAPLHVNPVIAFGSLLAIAAGAGASGASICGTIPAVTGEISLASIALFTISLFGLHRISGRSPL